VGLVALLVLLAIVVNAAAGQHEPVTKSRITQLLSESLGRPGAALVGGVASCCRCGVLC